MHREDDRDDCRDNLRDSCPGSEMHMHLNLLSRTTRSSKRPRKEKNSIKFKKTSNRYWLLTLMKKMCFISNAKVY